MRKMAADKKWTKEQSDAITARSGTLLLSAAAGSGKTAVLVERIIGLLTDENDPVHPSELLAVTFTNAAAAEMRERISSAVNDLICAHPDNAFYSEIRMKLPEATICTMDSFCIKLVRENYHELGVEPDFTVLDDSDKKNMSAEAMNRVMDEESEKEIYHSLIYTTGSANSDSELCARILELYENSLSYPFPEKYIESVKNMYSGTDGTKKWQGIIKEYARDGFIACKNVLKSAYDSIANDEMFSKAYGAGLINILDVFDSLIEITDSDCWDETAGEINKASLPRVGTAPRGHADDKQALRVKGAVKYAKESLKKIASMFCASDEENKNDIKTLAPIVGEICLCANKYAEYLSELKEMKNAYDFSDFMHMALKILIGKDGQPTELAKTISKTYREILIDEYQDTNDAQDMLFSAVSRDGKNLFTVGDVKQSIYSFRMARPDIFTAKFDSYPPYDTTSNPSKIILSKNFRSRKGVLEAVNYLFEYTMTKTFAGIDYNSDEKLYYGGLYNDDKEIPLEMHFISESSSDHERDAKYIGKIIKSMLAEGVTVKDGGAYRKCSPRDFCILLRSTKTKAEIYAKALNDMGIGAYAEKRRSLFDTPEINMFMSLIKAVDNPSDDVSVLSLMYSPAYGFTPDELAEIRSSHTRETLYNAVRIGADNGLKKCAHFINDMQKFRELSSVMGVGEYISALLEETSFASIVSAMEHGGGRRTNLYMLSSLASQYEENTAGGVGGFISYINKSIKNGAQIPAGGDVSASADVVRIMSIHKSKGLEFPFVILADCSSRFNDTDLNKSMILDSKTGIGMKIYDPDNFIKYDTLSYSAARIGAKKSMRAEELRILYVALTRAREKIITVARVNDITDRINSALLTAGADSLGYFEAMNSSSFLDWLLSAYVRHPDSILIRKDCAFDDIAGRDGDFSIKFVTDDGSDDSDSDGESSDVKPDENIIKELENRCSFVYPQPAFGSIPLKRTASEFEKNKFTPEFFAKSRPAFLSGKSMTPGERGTANHLFLQSCDFDNALNDFEKEKRRLIDSGILNEKQGGALLENKIKDFLKSELCTRMKNAEKLYREKQFAVFLPAYMFDETLPDYARNEPVFVQGMADAVFVENGRAYVVDYKTDKVNDPAELVERYNKQMEIYILAMRQTLRLDADTAYIYSLEKGETIIYRG